MKRRMHILYVIMAIVFVTPAEALKSEFILASESYFNLHHDLALSPDGRYLYLADNGKGMVASVNDHTPRYIGIGEYE